MRRLALLTCLAALAGPVAADEALSDTRAFEDAGAISFYGFDACGDALGGRIYRQALAAKFASCPFSPAARTRFADRSRAQRTKSSAALQRLITDHDGLPVRLDGMTRTCHEQMASPEYQRLRGLLDGYSSGSVPVDTVLPQPCDSPSLLPG